MSTKLERAARQAWIEWGEYAKWTFCDGCGQARFCRAHRQRGSWVCLPCFDQELHHRRRQGRRSVSADF